MNLKIKALIIIIISMIICSIIFNYLHYILTIDKTAIHPVTFFLILYLGFGFLIGFFSNHIMNIKNKMNTTKFSLIIGLFLVFSIVSIELYFEYLDMLKGTDSTQGFYLIVGVFLYFLLFSPIIATSILGGLTNYYIRKKTDFLKAKL